MSDMMTFPNTWEEFEKHYGFTDNEEVYTNGARLIPSFRVKQLLDHLLSEEPQKWIPCSERLPFAEYGESNNVLATCGHRENEDSEYRWIKTLYFNGGNWCYPTGETYLEKVYAWMPLPEPWGGDSE